MYPDSTARGERTNLDLNKKIDEIAEEYGKYIMVMGFTVLAGVLIFCHLHRESRYDESMDSVMKQAYSLLPDEYAENAELYYQGTVILEDKAIKWFIAENAKNDCYYLPLEYDYYGFQEYVYNTSYETAAIMEDVEYIPWSGGYAIVINNKNCVSYQAVTLNGVKYTSEIDEYPHFTYSASLSECIFYDANGNELIKSSTE